MDAFAKKNQINGNVLDLSENIFAYINGYLLFMSIKTFKQYIRKRMHNLAKFYTRSASGLAVTE